MHLKTKGYEDGEEVRVELETVVKKIIVTGKVKNSEVIIRNIESSLKEYK